MKKIKCFAINGIELFLEVVLIEYDSIPMLFLCKANKEYYLVLCTDTENLSYIIINPKVEDIIKMLEGKMAMKDIFSAQEHFWDVESGEEISDDNVTLKKITEIDETVLPFEGEVYEIISDEVREYLMKLKKRNYQESYDYTPYSEQLFCGKQSGMFLTKDYQSVVKFDFEIGGRASKTIWDESLNYQDTKLSFEKFQEIKVWEKFTHRFICSEDSEAA